MVIPRILVAALTAATLAGSVLPARAGERTFSSEWWIGGGLANTDYQNRLAVLRAGAGMVLIQRFTLGANVQADREHWFGLGYAGIVFPAIGDYELYGRFHIGRRDDLDDDAVGWTGGIRTGTPELKLYVEAYGVIDPGYGNGVCFGITF